MSRRRKELRFSSLAVRRRRRIRELAIIVTALCAILAVALLELFT
jgi:hypothetical protein